MVRKKLIRAAMILTLAGALSACSKNKTGKDTETEVVKELQPQAGVFAFDVEKSGQLQHVGPTATPAPTPKTAPAPKTAVTAGEDTAGSDTQKTPDPAVNINVSSAAGVSYYDIKTLDTAVYTDEQMAQIKEFYRNTVFTGDSVLLGFKNYCAKSDDEMLKNFKFLASGSYSLHNAFWEVSEKSIHPLYQGQQYPLWESIPMMGAERMFLFFGINDVALGIDDALNMYPLLIEKIQAGAPGIDVNILSATYTMKDKSKGALNNSNLAIFNEGAAKIAAERGYGYIDIADTLSDGAGNLLEKYCSDNELHENQLAYQVWVQILKAYAADRLGFGPGTH